ncbi:hypothetical protein PR048_011408 [Dryococelus australis]|uniref:Uncharacterized protein n=1 Tax=Dryococelus australis TaxID=614101 RepID=A0ABQ9HLJ3_9NEOP|nr:hypothetical protein PR048_011408 [Dryococelus australis]
MRKEDMVGLVGRMKQRVGTICSHRNTAIQLEEDNANLLRHEEESEEDYDSNEESRAFAAAAAHMKSSASPTCSLQGLDRFTICTTTNFKELLDDIYADKCTEVKKKLSGKSVCMALVGWSNVHNNPIVCVSVNDVLDQCTHLTEIIDTEVNSHTYD